MPRRSSRYAEQWGVALAASWMAGLLVVVIEVLAAGLLLLVIPAFLWLFLGGGG